MSAIASVAMPKVSKAKAKEPVAPEQPIDHELARIEALEQETDVARRRLEKATGLRDQGRSEIALTQKELADITARLQSGLPSSEATGLLREKSRLAELLEAQRSEAAMLDSNAKAAASEAEPLVRELSVLKLRRAVRETVAEGEDALEAYRKALGDAECYALSYAAARVQAFGLARQLENLGGRELGGRLVELNDAIEAELRDALGHERPVTWLLPPRLRSRIIDLCGR